MLTDKERAEIMAGLHHYAHKQAACVEALKIVQRHKGWISDEIAEIAELLGMTADELDGIATFYSLLFRKPVGRHVILICDSISCWVMGCDRVHEHLTERLGITFGETTPDGSFSLLPVACLGACDRAPAMMIDDTLYTNVTHEKIDEIIEGYRREKQ